MVRQLAGVFDLCESAKTVNFSLITNLTLCGTQRPQVENQRLKLLRHWPFSDEESPFTLLPIEVKMYLVAQFQKSLRGKRKC